MKITQTFASLQKIRMEFSEDDILKACLVKQAPEYKPNQKQESEFIMDDDGHVTLVVTISYEKPAEEK